MTLFSVGHGRLDREGFLQLLRVAEIELVVEHFAAYAAYTRTAPFRDAFTRLLDRTAQSRTAMMCSESVWWRCHRRLVADVAVLGSDVPVLHVMPDGRLSPHVLSAGARKAADGRLFWDVSAPET